MWFKVFQWSNLFHLQCMLLNKHNAFCCNNNKHLCITTQCFVKITILYIHQVFTLILSLYILFLHSLFSSENIHSRSIYLTLPSGLLSKWLIAFLWVYSCMCFTVGSHSWKYTQCTCIYIYIYIYYVVQCTYYTYCWHRELMDRRVLKLKVRTKFSYVFIVLLHCVIM